MVASLLMLSTLFAFAGCKDNKDTNKPQIISGITLIEEQYGIAGKKGNDALLSKINEALIAIADDEMKTIGNTYGLTSEIAVSASTTNPLANASDASWTNLASRNKVIIGYTVFAPIAYEVKDDVPTKGYDIELAKAVFDYLNDTYNTQIAVEFLEIEWSAKEALLEGGSIDLVWNGLTITDERKANMCISVPYLNNKQVALTMSKNADKFTTKDSLKDAVMGAEDGSAGEEQIETLTCKEYVKCDSQLDAFNKLKAGTLDVIVIDSVMAGYYISLEK